MYSIFFSSPPPCPSQCLVLPTPSSHSPHRSHLLLFVCLSWSLSFPPSPCCSNSGGYDVPVPRYVVNKLNSEIGMVAVVRAISSAMGLPKPAAVEAPRSVEKATA